MNLCKSISNIVDHQTTHTHTHTHSLTHIIYNDHFVALQTICIVWTLRIWFTMFEFNQKGYQLRLWILMDLNPFVYGIAINVILISILEKGREGFQTTAIQVDGRQSSCRFQHDLHHPCHRRLCKNIVLAILHLYKLYLSRNHSVSRKSNYVNGHWV